MEELVDQTNDVLDTVWNLTSKGKTYPEKRMAHFLDVFGSLVGQYVQQRLDQLARCVGLTAGGVDFEPSLRHMEQELEVS